jgi:hypothetical protein
MRRIQLHLDEELDEALAREASRRREPKAKLIRDYLWGHVDASGGDAGDPLDELVGLSDGPPLDDGEAIDDVVYR